MVLWRGTRVLDDSSQDSSTGNHSAARIPSQSSQVGLSSVLTQPSCNEHNINMPKPLLVDTVLSFIVAFRLKGDKASLKQVVTERFCNEDVVVAKKLLWENCAVHLGACGLQFHYRRDSDTRIVSLWLTLKIFYKHLILWTLPACFLLSAVKRPSCIEVLPFP